MKGMGLDARIGSAFLSAGLGYGGCCFPKDTDSLVHTAADARLRLRAAAGGGGHQPRAGRPLRATDRARRWAPLDGTRRSAVLGLAFKPNTDDMREAKSRRGHPAAAASSAPPCAPTTRWPWPTRAQMLPAAVDVLRVALRGGRRRGRGRAGHGVERVQVPEPRAAAGVDAAAGRSSTAATSGSRSGCAASASSTTRSAASPSCRLTRRGDGRSAHASAGDRRRRGSSAPTSASSCSARGCDVVGMDNFITGSADNLAGLWTDPRFTFVQPRRHRVHRRRRAGSTGSCTSRAPPRRCDYLELPIQTLKVGALGTHNALGLAKAKGARFLLASTSEVYGDPLVHPQREDYWGNVNPVGPRGVYDEAKRFAEAITMAYHRAHGVDTRIVRIFNTLRAAHAAERRARDPRLHDPGADGRARSPCSATARRRARSSTSPISSTGCGA